MIEIDVYETAAGDRPFEKWFARVDRHARNRILIAFGKLENGNTGSLKSVGGGVSELKSRLVNCIESISAEKVIGLSFCSMAARKSGRVKTLPKRNSYGAII